MTNFKRPLTLSNPKNRFELSGNKEIFYSIVSDMNQYGGDLAPSEHWNWKLCEWHTAVDNNTAGYTEELFDRSYSQLKMMLDPWVGVTGMKPIEADSVVRYEDFLRSIDQLGLLPDDILSYGQSNDWRETDLGTVMDVNLIEAFCYRKVVGKIAICEVGGGYGRLAEVMMGGVWDSIHYVLVDAVPGSLMYAYLYLKSQLPNRHIGAYFNGDPYNEDYDCYILPAWHTYLLGSSAFDICVNIESMQEMEQHQVDYYLDLFDRLIMEDGQIYLSNARDYVFKGQWKIPNHWETLFLNNTPRSWSADHPTHILQNKSGDFSNRREVLEGVFKQQVDAWHRVMLVNEQKRCIDDKNTLCAELEKTIEDLTNNQSSIGFFSKVRLIWRRFIHI
jgi:hypothetical protein